MSNRTDSVLRYIRRYVEQYGQSPSRREIAYACDIPSISSVTYHLDKLELDGLIQIRRNVARGIRLTE
jgi:SOS-response transcriptional repressor LexA